MSEPLIFFKCDYSGTVEQVEAISESPKFITVKWNGRFRESRRISKEGYFKTKFEAIDRMRPIIKARAERARGELAYCERALETLERQ